MLSPMPPFRHYFAVDAFDADAIADTLRRCRFAAFTLMPPAIDAATPLRLLMPPLPLLTHADAPLPPPRRRR